MDHSNNFGARYNWVPLHPKVFRPAWSGLVYHDIPLSEGWSGSLEFQIETESPIFIRDKPNLPDFMHLFEGSVKRYFIPGSTLQGWLRSLVGIIGFGSMHGQYNDLQFSQRDFSNELLYNKNSANILAGWIRLNNGRIEWQKTSFRSVNFKEIDSWLENITHNKYLYSNIFMNKDNLYNPKDSQHRTAKYKYECINNLLKNPKSKIPIQWAEGESLIVSGQPNMIYIEEKYSKKNEYIFKNPVEDNWIVPNKVDLDLIWENCVKAHSCNFSEKTKESDLNMWIDVLKQGPMPIFYLSDRSTKELPLKFGFTRNFRWLYKNSIKHLLPWAHQDSNVYMKPDLSNLIFGYVEGQEALKSRIQFEPAFAEGNITPLNSVPIPLESPKPTYYPTYLQQSPGAYRTYEDAFSESEEIGIRGRKRYPVHMNISQSGLHPKTREKGSADFQPLPKGTQFIVKVHLHNLLPEELGAIFSALTWHNQNETGNSADRNCFHQLGLAKGFGYGKCTVKMNWENSQLKPNSGEHTGSQSLQEKAREWMGNFETLMDSFLLTKGGWSQNVCITELYTMATEPENDHHLFHMSPKDHAKAKGNLWFLDPYSKIVGFTHHPASLTSRDEKTEEDNLTPQWEKAIQKLEKLFA